MKNKKILIIAMAVFILFAVKGFAVFRKINIIDNVVVCDNSRAEIPNDWRLIMVNSKNAVPDDYSIELTQLANGISVDSRIYPDLQKMFDDMREQGVYPVVSEGYRTNEQQQNMMTQKINGFIDEGYSKKTARELAEKLVAEAGKSEHELGIALDINADADFSSDEDVYDWLAENAYRYGFILRYPSDKENITGIDYEPWHYRYVGAESALQIYSQQITLEEFLNATE